MARASDIARYLLYLAAQEPEESVTHLRLQKLLYYVQGWHLAIRQEPAFDSRVEAWVNGPVVRDVWLTFKEQGRRPIDLSEEGKDSESLDEDLKGFIRSIWQHYGRFSDSELYRKTHNETPWLETLGDRPADEIGQDEIDQELMKSYFEYQRERHEVPGLELNKLAESEREFRAGAGTPLREVVPELVHGHG